MEYRESRHQTFPLTRGRQLHRLPPEGTFAPQTLLVERWAEPRTGLDVTWSIGPVSADAMTVTLRAVVRHEGMHLSDLDRAMIKRAFFPLHARITEHLLPGRLILIAHTSTGLGPSAIVRRSIDKGLFHHSHSRRSR
jgi:hypothetical protein